MSDGNNSNLSNKCSEGDESFGSNVTILDETLSQEEQGELNENNNLLDFTNISNITECNDDKYHTGLFDIKANKYLTEMQNEIINENIKKYEKINSINDVDVDTKFLSQMTESERIINSIKKNNNNINNMQASKGSLFKKRSTFHKKKDYVTDVIQEDSGEYELSNNVEEINKWTKEELTEYNTKYPDKEAVQENKTTTAPTEQKKQTTNITSNIPKEGDVKRQPLLNKESKQQRDERKRTEFNNKVKEEIKNREKKDAQLAKEKANYYNKKVNNKQPRVEMPSKQNDNRMKK